MIESIVYIVIFVAADQLASSLVSSAEAYPRMNLRHNFGGPQIVG